MRRVLSGAVLLVAAVAAIWFLGTWPLLALAEAVLLLAAFEYSRLARALGLEIPLAFSDLIAMAACAAVVLPGTPVAIVLMAGLVAIGGSSVARGRPGPGALADAAGALFPAIYLGLPLGALVAIHGAAGREALLLLLITVMISDTGQYYTGRTLGRRPLAPAISPGKTIEGALGGFVAGVLCLVFLGRVWLPSAPVSARVLLGIALVASGIIGDLFESRLKRAAGLKDSSALIPGHGGVLDRIDALLFAAPIFYIFLRYAHFS
jgi:phosphatidate cytidylyltransferase